MSGHGRCGDAAPAFIGSPPELCELAAGHAGWHRQGRTEWSPPRSAAVSGDDGLREVVEEAVTVPGVGPFTQMEQVRRVLALPEVAALRAKAAAADRVRELMDEPAPATYAEWHNFARDVTQALDGDGA